jgi:hypothetical protein
VSAEGPLDVLAALAQILELLLLVVEGLLLQNLPEVVVRVTPTRFSGHGVR